MGNTNKVKLVEHLEFYAKMLPNAKARSETQLFWTNKDGRTNSITYCKTLSDKDRDLFQFMAEMDQSGKGEIRFLKMDNDEGFLKFGTRDC